MSQEPKNTVILQEIYSPFGSLCIVDHQNHFSKSVAPDYLYCRRLLERH
jgi:hypothetical protein